MALGKLGFGTMRLPLDSPDQADINLEETAKMMDKFLADGFTYVDTSFVYHNGHSEHAVKKTLTSRHPRDSYTIATKLPTFILSSEEQVPELFEKQLENLGVDYVDYYLMHNLNRILYNGLDGKGGVVKNFHIFDYFKKWKEEGKIRHIGFSFHDSVDVLDQILSEHPETDFVQIVLNYYDTDSPFVQAQKCYDVIHKHGKQVVIMEPVKGGTLARVPQPAESDMKELEPAMSDASYAVRFAADHDGVIAVLSGMSNLEQMDDNTSYMKDFKPLNEAEKEAVAEAKKDLQKEWQLLPDAIEELHGFKVNGVDAGDIVESYNSIQIQPNPYFACELNYLKGQLAGQGHALKDPIEPVSIILKDGRDVTKDVLKAYQFLVDHSF